MLRIFGWSFVVTAVGLAVAYVYGGLAGLVVALILTILEVSLSFDNAVVNATVLVRMNAFWQRMFLTVGILIAVFGMRLLFPFVVVGLTAHLSPSEALRLALEKGDPEVPGTYGYLLNEAHPSIAAFGGMFLLMLFLNFVFEEREFTWLSWIERPLARIGTLGHLPTVISLASLTLAATVLAGEASATVMVAGSVGIMTYLVITSLGELFEESAEIAVEVEAADAPRPTVSSGVVHGGGLVHPGGIVDPGTVVKRGSVVNVAGKAAFFLFLYLEVLDASFSFDGVIGAFAITSDPIIIALGLGIGAMYIRSLTVFFVHNGTLGEYVYLEHGAHWAIGALAAILLLTIKFEVHEVITGFVGVAFILAGFLSSLARNRRPPAAVPVV